MALPLSFSNSFFTPDLRQGVEVLWAKLEAGVHENEEILRFVGDRASASSATARALRDSAESQFRANGFAKDDGASLRRTFEGIKYETGQVAKAHENVARNLDSLIIKPFTTWSHQHEGRISELKDQLNDSIRDWEDFQNEVRKLKDARSVKCGLLDEAEDDLKFAPTSPGSVHSTSSSSRPRSGSGGAAAAASLAFAQNTASQAAQAAQQASTTASNLARTLTQRMKVSPTAHALKTRLERMRLEAKERELVAAGKDPSRLLEEEELVDEEGAKLDRNEKREVAMQERTGTNNKDLPNLKVDELEIAGVVKHPKDWSVIFARAKREVPTTAVKVPLIGTTPDAHSGEDLVLWFKDKLEDLGGSLSRAHEFCRQLSEDLAILKLVGEIGNKFYDSSDTFYAWRPDAFALDQLQAEINDANSDLPVAKEQDDNLTKLPEPTRERKSNPLTMSPRLGPVAAPPALPEKDSSLSKSPLSPTLGSTSNGHRHTTSSGLSRSNTLSFLSSAYENAARNVSSSYTKIAKTGFTGAAGDRLEKLQKEAEVSEEAYRVALRELDETRMQTEELVHHCFNRAQKYEFERLTAIKSVFSTYTSTLASLNSPLQHSSERTILLQEAFVPSSDLNSIIERYRTGPFRPKPSVWVDWYHEATDVRFGIDLRHWRDTNDQSKKLPELIPAILGVIEEGYTKLPSDDERRRTWIYDVPLQYTHKLRNIVDSAASPVRIEDIKRFDLPVLASGIKLWLLELAVSLVPQAMYADVKAIYPSVGANVAGDDSRIASLKTLLERLPKIHLVILDTILSHLETLLNCTKADGEEASDKEYMSKLGATFGPCIVRPQADTSKTLNDRFPALFFVDLLKHYEALLPPVLALKNKVEEERYAPKRQRTKMIDQRLSRKAVEGQDAKGIEQLLKEEKVMKAGSTTSEQSQAAPQMTAEPEEVSANQTPQQAKAEPLENDSNQTPKQEKLEIPLPPSSESEPSSEIPESTTPGFATPPEVVEAMSTQIEPISSTDKASSQQMQQSVSAEGAPADRSIEEEEEDLDKPLATTTLLSRSQTGSSAKRTAGLSAKTRGPRPMSLHGGAPPAGTAGSSSDKVTSPTGSPLLGGQSGVRARAAMFEQSTKK